MQINTNLMIEIHNYWTVIILWNTGHTSQSFKQQIILIISYYSGPEMKKLGSLRC